MRANHKLGVRGELLAIDHLVANGCRVYRALDGHQHPDLVVITPDDQVASVECRVVTTNNKSRAKSTQWKRRKRSDRCDLYAWISPDLKTVEFEAARKDAA